MGAGEGLQSRVRKRGHTEAAAGFRRSLRTRNIVLVVVGAEAVLLALLRIAGCS